MAGFDPDRYLQQKSAPTAGFDPDAYLSGKMGDEMAPLKSRSKIAEEMHPAFTKTDRWQVKTFGNDENAAVNFLQEKHPDLEVKSERGRIVAKGRGETDWRPLDPDTGFFSSDFGNDLMDVAGDVGTGIVTTGATAGGALAGAALGAGAGGIGAVPGALAGGALGGGLSASALEALRQFAGKGIGVNEEVSGRDIALQGVIGAASPLLFGGGATAAQAGAKAAGRGALTYANPFLGAKEGVKNLGKSTARTLLPKKLAAQIPANVDLAIPESAKAALKAQAGVPSHLFQWGKKVLPKVGETTSGIQADVIKTWADNPEAVENLTEGGVRNLMTREIGKARTALAKRDEFVGTGMNEARYIADELGQAGRHEDELYRVQMDKVRRPFMELMSSVEDLSKGGTEAEQVQAEAISKTFEKYFVRKVPTTGLDDFGEPIVERTIDNSLTANQAFSLKDRLLEIAEFDQPANPIRTAARQAIRSIDDQIEKVTRRGHKASAAQTSAKNGINRERPRGEVDPDFSYRNMQDEYKINREFQDDIKQALKNPKSAYALLSNLGNKSRVVDREAIAAFDARFGTDLIGLSQKLSAHKHFSDAPWLGMSSGGTTATARVVPLADTLGTGGYWLGANSGLGQGGAGVGQTIGQALGGVVGGPAAIKRYMKWNNALGKGKELLRDAGANPNRVLSPWMLMEQRRIDE